MKELLKDPIIKQAFLLLADKDKPNWKQFLKERYNGGKKLVKNTNPKTQYKYKQVSMNTLYKTDIGFKNKVNKEYQAWMQDPDQKDLFQEDIKDTKVEPVPEKGKKFPSYLKKYNTSAKKFFASLTEEELEPYMSIKEEIKNTTDPFELNKLLADKVKHIYPLFEKYMEKDINLKDHTRYLIRSWQSGSGDRRASWEIHGFVSSLGYRGSTYVSEADEEKAETEKWGQYVSYKTNHSLGNAYAFQQYVFKDFGLTHLPLYRGVSAGQKESFENKKPKFYVDDKILVESRAAASTTNTEEKTEEFGDLKLLYNVPVGHILLSPFMSQDLSLYSKSAFSEDEYVVMGLSDLEATVMLNDYTYERE